MEIKEIIQITFKKFKRSLTNIIHVLGHFILNLNFLTTLQTLH